MNDTQTAGLIVLVIFMAMGYYAWGYIAYALAYTDMIFMFVPEGQIRFIMKGKSLRRVVVNIKGKTLCTSLVRQMIRDGIEVDGKKIILPPEYTSVDEIPEGNLIDIPDGMADPNHTEFNKKYGVFLVGMPFIHTPLEYPFRWDKWEKRADAAGYQTIPRNEPVGSLFYRFPYPILSRDTEIKGNLSYNIQLLVTMEAVNPARALFATLPPGTWLEQAEASVLAVTRTWASNKEIDDLREAKSAGGEESLPGVVKKINGGREVSGVIHRGITELFGMKVVAVNLVEIQVSTTDPEMEKILITKARAVQQALADVETAKGKKGAAIILAEGNAEATRLQAGAQAAAIEVTGTAKAGVIEKQYGAAAKIKNGAAMFIAEAGRDASVNNTTARVYAPGGKVMPTVSVDTE